MGGAQKWVLRASWALSAPCSCEYHLHAVVYAEHKLLHCPDLDELRYKLDYQDIAENILTPNEKLDLGKLSKLTARCNLFN